MAADVGAARDPRAFWRRLLFAFLVFASTAVATLVLWRILAPGGVGWINGILLSLFAVLFAWICTSFWTVMIGFAAMAADRVRGRRRRAAAVGGVLPWREGGSRTALLVPICNEDFAVVYARIEAMVRSLRDSGDDGIFDVFILSDSSDPDTWVAEEMAWSALCRKLAASDRIFYRHRPRNTEFKSGNIAEFCRRWGRNYRYMIVLDADSLMSGPTMAEMVRRMDRNPRLGLLQSAPAPIRGRTPFARMQQFAAALHGPAYARGAAFWQLSQANYWGHNAIIRIAAFMRHCGLPTLPGTRPFGGQIMSHDFIEAAMLVRAGWEVQLAPDLDDSYEEAPGTLLSYAKRDYRWCQGNLQHLRPLFARGLHPLSRLHLVMGIMTYVASPLWLVFVLVSAADFWRRTHTAHVYFAEDSFFPLWPISHAMEAQILFGATLGILFLPKIVSLLFLFFQPGRAAGFGGRLTATAGVVMETLISVLIAPILMAFHTRFVALTLLGRHTGWRSQPSGRPRSQGAAVWRAHAEHVIGGLAGGIAAWFYLPEMFWWLVPVLAGLVFSVPLSLMLGSPAVGARLGRWGVFCTPSELNPPPILRAFGAALSERPPPDAMRPIDRVIADPGVNALHTALLSGTRSGLPRPRDDVVRLAAREGIGALAVADQRDILSHPESVMWLHAQRVRLAAAAS